MEIKAQLNNLRITPRKVRLVSGLLKGLDAVNARNQLNHLAKRSAKPFVKLLDSALANAQNNFGLVKGNLFIKNIIVNEGAKLKRFRPKGFGMTSPIEKKTSRIMIVLDERTPGLKAEKKKAEFKPEMPKEIEAIGVEKEKTIFTERKPTFTKESKTKKKGVFSDIKVLGRKFFRRKVI